MKSYTDFFITRPVYGIIISIFILLLGLYALSQLSVRQYPNITPNAITIKTSYPGADAVTMANFITTPIENSLTQINGIDYITSTSNLGKSTVIINLDLDSTIADLLPQVQAALSGVTSQLPPNAKTPQVIANSGVNPPMMFIGFQSSNLSPEAISDFLERTVVNQLQGINGVQMAKILGEREYAMRINLSPEKMKTYDLAPSDIINALNQQNVISANGVVYDKNVQFSIRANTDLDDVKAFNDMLLADQNGTLIHLKQVGQAQLGALSQDTQSFVDGKPNITIGVITYPDANQLSVAKSVRQLMPTIKHELPAGMTSKIRVDDTLFIQKSLKEVTETIFIAIIIICIIMFLFLGSWRTTIIPAMTIPLAIIGTAYFMYLFNYSINTLTLLAWVLAVGLVVDDGIVVVENIQRYIENGEKPFNAAILGAREIRYSVIAMSLTLAIVYAPVGFSEGIVGKLFQEFTFTLALAVILSGVIALTLSPLLCAYWLKPGYNRFYEYLQTILQKIERAYRHSLQRIIFYPKTVIVAILILATLGITALYYTPSELAPKEDEGRINTYMEGPANATINYMTQYLQNMAKIFETIPEAASNLLAAGIPHGVNTGIGRLHLIDWSKRHRSASDITKELNQAMIDIAGLNIFVYQPPALPGLGNLPLEYVLESPSMDESSYQQLYNAGIKLLADAENFPGISRAKIDLRIDKAYYQVTIDRSAAYSSGVTVEQIANAFNLYFGEPQQYQFSMNNKAYYVVPELTRNYKFRANANVFQHIYIRGTNDKLVPMSNFVKIERISGPETINHFQALPSVTLSATLAQGYSLGTALDYLNDKVSSQFGNQFYVDYSGQARQYQQANNAFIKIFIFSVLLIYLILAAQFESFLKPLIIMVSVPMSLAGGLIMLYLTNGTINVYTQIALITLMGLITKHGILIIDFINRISRETNLGWRNTIIKAARLRLRPILMTTLVMVLGALPLILNRGPGAHAREQLGWVIIGGMTIGTLFSLYVIPVLCTFNVIKKPNKRENLSDAIE